MNNTRYLVTGIILKIKERKKKKKKEKKREPYHLVKLLIVLL